MVDITAKTGNAPSLEDRIKSSTQNLSPSLRNAITTIVQDVPADSTGTFSFVQSMTRNAQPEDATKIVRALEDSVGSADKIIESQGGIKSLYDKTWAAASSLGEAIKHLQADDLLTRKDDKAILTLATAGGMEEGQAQTYLKQVHKGGNIDNVVSALTTAMRDGLYDDLTQHLVNNKLSANHSSLPPKLPPTAGKGKQ